MCWSLWASNMTEAELRRDVVEQATAWLGCRESDGSFKFIIDLYNRYRKPGDYCMTYNDPWCACYVSAVGMAVSVSNALPGQPYELIPSSAACDPMIAQYKAIGRWVEDDNYLPAAGDIIFYDWDDSGAGDNTGSSDHVGIVTGVNGKSITVVEGNKSDSVSYRTIQRNGRYIRGYGRPDYARYANGEDGQGVIIVDPPAEQPNVSEKPTSSSGIALPMLRRGSTGECVRSAQMLLNGHDANVGRWGCDGDFGAMTEAAVLAYQRRNGLEADGIIGNQTWKKLLGV